MSKEPSKVLPQYLAAAAANLATVTVGCALGWTSPALPRIQYGEKNEGWLYLNNEEGAWVTATMSAGATVGPFIVANIADRIGRKWSLLSTALLALVGWIIIIFVETFAPLCVARFIHGLGVGMVFALIPMYVGEIAELRPETVAIHRRMRNGLEDYDGQMRGSEHKWCNSMKDSFEIMDRVRGALGSFVQLQVVVGFLIQYCIGPYVNYTTLAIVTCAIPVLFAVTFFFIPESPYYLLSVDKTEEATEALMWFRGQSREGVQQELKMMQISVEEAMRSKTNISDLVKTKGNRMALLFSMELVAGQQLCGINAVLFNSETIFAGAGGSLGPAESTIIIGVVMFLASGVTPLVVDRLGRKILLHVSAVGMIIGLIVLGVYFYLMDDGQDVSNIGMLPILSLVLYIIVYSMGYGGLPWAVLGELFPPNVKSNASACTASFCWFICFFVTRFYVDMATGMGSAYTFWIFAIFAFASGIFVLLLLPETKGKSLQEIQEILNK